MSSILTYRIHILMYTTTILGSGIEKHETLISKQYVINLSYNFSIII
jgi:hypothetical protein